MFNNMAEDGSFDADATKTGVKGVLVQALPLLRLAIAFETGLLVLALLNALALDGGDESTVILQMTIGLSLLFLIPSVIVVYYTQTVIQDD